MGLYDGYKLSNSSYLSQYVGNIVPELKDFSTTMQARYNSARDTDDALVEAMGNLQHLDSEEDTTYANEMKQKFIAQIQERSKRSDYENMERRTKRDAQMFASDYVPLVNRLKGMQSIQERVLQDKEIFSPETKSKILGKIKHMNRAKTDANGDFVRDSSGKIQLGAISDWAYAKDVDIDKKNAEILDKLQATETQSGFGTSSDGKMLQSVKREVRTPQDLARLAKERMQNDPEIKAMIERNVDLSTYHITPEMATEMATKENVSIYDQLKRAGNSETHIKAYATAHGLSLEAMKSKPLDVLRNDYASKGRNPQDADVDFVRHKVRKEITDPHINFIANLLKIDKTEIDARVDPDYAAKATADAVAAGTAAGDVMPFTMTADNAETSVGNISSLQENAYTSEQAALDIKKKLQTAVGGYLGINKPNIQNTAQWNDKTSQLIAGKATQGKLIQELVNQGKEKEANDLTTAFKKYNETVNRAIIARAAVNRVAKESNVTKHYEDYKQQTPKKEQIGFNEFAKIMTGEKVLPDYTHDRVGGSKVLGQALGLFEKVTGTNFSPLANAKKKYEEVANEVLSKNGKTFQVRNTVFEPSSSGFIKNNTDMLENAAKEGRLSGKDMMTGETIDQIMTKELGSGFWGKSVKPEDKADPNSDYNKKMSMLKLRVNIDIVGSNGQPTATLKLPSGAVRTVTLDDVPTTMVGEMSARMINQAGKQMTQGDAKSLMQSASQSEGWRSITYMTPIDVMSATPSANPYQLNDIYYMRVTNSGIKGVAEQNVYSLYVKNGDKLVPIFKNKESYLDIVNALGGSQMRQNVQTFKPQSSFD